MEQLKVQNNLLMQLINSKNRQTQILFQQYEQLAAENNSFQNQLEIHRSQIRDLKKSSSNSRQSLDNPSPQITESQLKDLRRRVVEYSNSIQNVEAQLKNKTALVIELEAKLQKAKVQLVQMQRQIRLLELQREHSKKLGQDLYMNQVENNKLKEQINSLRQELINIKIKQQQDTKHYEDTLQQKNKLIAQLQENIAGNSKKTDSQQSTILEKLNQKIITYQTQISSLKDAVLREQNDKKAYIQFSDNLYNDKRQLQLKLQQLNNTAKIVDQNAFVSKQAHDQKLRQLQTVINNKDTFSQQLQTHLETIINRVRLFSKELAPAGQIVQTENLSKQQVQLGRDNGQKKYIQSIEEIILQIKTYFVTKQDQISQMHQLIKSKDQNLLNLAEVLQNQAMQFNKQQTSTNLLQKPLQQAEDNQILKQNIVQLQLTIATLQQALQDSSKNIEQHKIRIEQLENALSQTAQMTDTLEPKNIQKNTQYQKIEELQHAFLAKEQSMQMLTRHLVEMNQKVVQLEQELQKTSTQLNNCRHQLQQLKTHPSQLKQSQPNQIIQIQPSKEVQLQSQLQQKRSLLSEMELLLQHKQRQVNNIKNQIEQKENRRKQIQQEMEEKQRLFQEVEQTIAQTQQEAQHLQKQNQTLKNQNQRLDALVSSKQATLAKLQVKIKSHKQQISKLEIIQSNYQKQLQSLQQQKTTIQQTIKAAQTKQDQQNPSSIQNLEGEKEEEMAGLMDVMRNLQDQIRSKQQIIETLTQQIKNLKLYDNHQKKSLQSRDPQLAKQLQQKIAQSDVRQQRLQQLQLQNLSLRQKINDLTPRNNVQQSQLPLQQQQDVGDMEKELLQNIQAVCNQKEQELQQINQPAMNTQIRLNDQENLINQYQNLTTLQALQKLITYLQSNRNIQYIRFATIQLYRLYCVELQNVQSQNNRLNENVTELVQINESFKIELDKLHDENKQKQAVIQQKCNVIEQMQKNIKEVQHKFSREIQELRSSILDQSPIQYQKLQKSANQESSKEQGTEKEVIQELKEQIAKIKRQNKLKDEQIAKLRPNFVKELNDLLTDSCINNQEDKEMLEKVTLERDELLSKCHDYQEQIKDLQQNYSELMISVQNNQNAKKKSIIQEDKQSKRQSKDYRKLEAELTERPNQKSTEVRHSRSYQHVDDHHSQKHTFQYEELQFSLGQKNQIISQLQGTILHIEKGFNAETMSLRRNIAQLNNQIIRLRKKLYQSNPNAMDLTELIRGSFAQQTSIDFFKYQIPTKQSQANFASFARVNNSSLVSYNTDNRGRNRETELPLLQNDKLTLGEKIIGRRCTANPYGDSVAIGFNRGSARSNILGWQSQLRP